jgi:hypothetical protein
LVAVGYQALYNNGNDNLEDVEAKYNTAIGFQAQYTSTNGYENTSTGYQTLFSNSTGYENSANGFKALYSNTIGISNTAIGWKALFSNTSGICNTAIGNSSASVASGNSYCTFLGFDADNNNTTSRTNSMALGNGSRISANNQVRIGNSSVDDIGGDANWTNTSDGRFKDNIREGVPGLEFITKLRPVFYNFNPVKKNRFLGIPDSLYSDELSQESIEKKSSILYTGFIAQDVEQAAKSINYDFSGVDIPKNENDYYGLRYATFVVPLVKAVQEQQQIIEQQKKRIEELEKLNARIECLEKLMEKANISDLEVGYK